MVTILLYLKKLIWLLYYYIPKTNMVTILLYSKKTNMVTILLYSKKTTDPLSIE
jgi:hypothetical protein